jgi:hypothetical protein
VTDHATDSALPGSTQLLLDAVIAISSDLDLTSVLTRIVVSATVAAVLVGYALALFAAGLRDRRRDRQDPETGRVDPVAAPGGHDRAGGRR